MSTIVRATCPVCGSSLRIPAAYLGQAVKCKKCGSVVRTKAKASETPPSPIDTAPPVPMLIPGTVPPPVPTAYPAPIPGFDLDNLDLDSPAPVQAPYPVPAPYPGPPAVGYPAGYPAAYPAPPAYPPQHYPYPNPPAPVGTPEFQPSEKTTAYRGGRYGKTSTTTKLVWAAVCLALTGGLVLGAVYGIPAIKRLVDEDRQKETAGSEKTNPANPGGGVTPGQVPTGGGGGGPQSAGGAYPRRLLFISISRYLYLNPLTGSQSPDRDPNRAVDLTKGFANQLAYTWRIPHDPSGKSGKDNELFLLSDTAQPDRIPLKNVIMGAYDGFFRTCRPQDRIVVYFGGHAVEQEGKAFLVPAEGDPEEPDTLIPLADFYAKLQACPATQKVVIWDVCRFNYVEGRALPGSEPMSTGLEQALQAAPPGVQVVTTCQTGENALEFSGLRVDDQIARGSCFLDAARYAGIKNKIPCGGPGDPIPIAPAVEAISKRLADLAKAGSADPANGNGPLTQTVKLTGAAPASLVAYNSAEPPAAAFEMPPSPKGASAEEVSAVCREFGLPGINPAIKLTDTTDRVPYPADALKDYKSDVPLTEIENPENKEKYKFRVAVLNAFKTIRDLWGANTNEGIRTTFKGTVSDAVKKEITAEQLKFPAPASAKLNRALNELNAVAGMRDDQPKRWQAHYEFVLGEVKARLAFVEEYNLLLGNIVTESLPALDAGKGFDAYALKPNERMKSKKDVQELAKEARDHFERVIADYKGTPWAIQAKRERGISLGLVWKPVSTARPEAP